MGAIKPSLWTDTYLTLWNDQCLEELLSKLKTRVGRSLYWAFAFLYWQQYCLPLKPYPSQLVARAMRQEEPDLRLRWGQTVASCLLPFAYFYWPTSQPTQSVPNHTPPISHASPIKLSAAKLVELTIDQQQTNSDPTFLDAPASLVVTLSLSQWAGHGFTGRIPGRMVGQIVAACVRLSCLRLCLCIGLCVCICAREGWLVR